MEWTQYRMNSKEQAFALYRSISEHHAFYRCDSIDRAMKEQVSKDFFDTFRNLFNDEHNTEQNYIFDTKRTCREAYDHARRVLFNFGSSTVQAMVSLEEPKDYENNELLKQEKYNKELKEKIDSFRESFLCRICRDQPISTVLQCGHMVCCSDCVKLCCTCPLCRADIETVTQIFLPVDLDLEG